MSMWNFCAMRLVIAVVIVVIIGECPRDDHRRERKLSLCLLYLLTWCTCCGRQVCLKKLWKHLMLALPPLPGRSSHRRVRTCESVLLSARFAYRSTVILLCASIARFVQQDQPAPTGTTTTNWCDVATRTLDSKWVEARHIIIGDVDRAPRSPPRVRRLMKRELAGEMLPARTRQPLLHASTCGVARVPRKRLSQPRETRGSAQ